jgi:hypothetical protein
MTYSVFYRRSSAFIGAPTGFALEGLLDAERFTRKPQGDEPATRGKNYITPSGLQRLKMSHKQGARRRVILEQQSTRSKLVGLMRVLTSDEVRQIEVEAARRADTPGSLLIQRASYAVAQFCLAHFKFRSVCVV